MYKRQWRLKLPHRYMAGGQKECAKKCRYMRVSKGIKCTFCGSAVVVVSVGSFPSLPAVVVGSVGSLLQCCHGLIPGS